MRRRGFTLVELMVALVILGAVTGAVGGLLRSGQRMYRRQVQRAELSDNLRAAAAILSAEFQELNANDTAGSDILAMTPVAVRYKAARSLYVTCADAVGSLIHLHPGMLGGLRALDSDRDSLLIYHEAPATSPRADGWTHVNLVRVGRGRACPSGGPSLDATVVPPVSSPAPVRAGSPVRAFEIVEIRRYADATGELWIGERRYHKSRGWTDLQPIAGPLALQGLRFAYLDSRGQPATQAGDVARIAVMVTGRGGPAQSKRAAPTVSLIDSVSIQVALRSNR